MYMEAAQEVLTCTPARSLRSTAAGGSPLDCCCRATWDDDEEGRVKEEAREPVTARQNYSAITGTGINQT